ncbi:MAG: TraB/GumN family protein [Erysipelotrichaceae bacterium]|nr:TraB/GumN family protein [Erysipelotrichaceae bacterium]
MENNVIKINLDDKEITLIPTAHVSKQSVELVEKTIDEIQPDSICIELDQDRYNSLTDPDKFKNTDIVKIIREKRVAMLLVNLILANYQKKMAANLNSTSGAEMMMGINKARELNAQLVLADRSVQTTFKRIWANMGFRDKLQMANAIISAIFDDEEISEEELANLQQSDILNSALQEVSKQFPKVAEVLVTERDKYLASKIRNAPGKKVVAILGAAHTLNVPKYIEQEYDISQYDVIPPKKTSSKIIGWLIPLIIVAAILFSFKINSDIGLKQIKTWIIFNGTLSAIGALLGGGHPLSILVAFLAAPVTSLNPLLAAGWFAGLTEAWLRKPTVQDFEKLSDDTSTFKGFWKNKVSRILLIVILASLGSSIGTFVSGLSIFSSLINNL